MTTLSVKLIPTHKRKLKLRDRKRPLTRLDAIKLPVLHFPHLSAWSMAKSINVWSCFMKILSTSNNSWGQADWNSGQTGKVNFLYFIILSAHSLCCFHWLLFFKEKKERKKEKELHLSFVTFLFSLLCSAYLCSSSPLSLSLPSFLSISLFLWIHMF